MIERRYLLIPERSGELLVPGARFNGQSVSDFFDGESSDGRKPLSAAAAATRLQVRQIPADAPQPWLPLRDLRLRYLQVPKQARAGVATSVELEMTADGASVTQLPSLAFPQSPDVQVFADPPQTEVQLVDGRPQATVRRRVSIVPLHAGTLRLAGPSVQWWDATHGVVRTATLPPLELQVAPGAAPKNVTSDAGSTGTLQPTADIAARQDGNSRVAKIVADSRHMLPWLAPMLGLAVLLGGWWIARHRSAGVKVAAANPMATIDAVPRTPSLAAALKTGKLASITVALCSAADLPVDDLDALCLRLDDAAQLAAVDQLRAARWGAGDAALALASLRAAFAEGLHLRSKRRQSNGILPPLYPQS